MEACICIDVDEEPSVYRKNIRKARKTHLCGECGGEISPGEEYEEVIASWEGYTGWERFKTCWFCLCIRRDFFTCGWYFGSLREYFREVQGWDYVEGPTPDDEAEETDPLFQEAA